MMQTSRISHQAKNGRKLNAWAMQKTDASEIPVQWSVSEVWPPKRKVRFPPRRNVPWRISRPQKRSGGKRPVADIDGRYAAQSMSAEPARICCRGCVMAAKGCRRKLVTAEDPVPVETGSAEVKQSLRRRG